MKNNILPFLALALISLAMGCASSHWHQDGKTAEETRADLAQCKKWVKAADVAFTIDSPKTKAALVRSCMEMKGYSESGQTNESVH